MKKITLFLAFTCILIGSTALSQNNFFTQDITPATTRTFNSIYFTDVNNGWAAGDTGNIYHTSDSGTTWTSQTNETLGDRITFQTLNSIFFIDDMNGWAAGNSGIILHTTDGGSTWIAQENINTSLDASAVNLYSIFFIGNMEGWATGLNGKIFYTSNGGSVWTLQNTLSSQLLYSIFFTDSMKGWATGLGGKIFYTLDGGSVWTLQTSGTTNHLSSIHFTDSDNGWAAGVKGTILHTTDGGTTWNVRTSGTLEKLNSIFFIDDSNGWVVGDSGTILRTTDGGINWATHTQTSDISQDLKSIFLIDSSNGWIAGTNGTILHTNEAPQITLPADFTGDDTASKILLTASQVSTNISSWNDGDTAANIAKMIDGNTNTDIVNDFAIHSLSANDKHITFTLNERYSKGEFKYYNRTLSDQDRVNGSTVEFFNGDTSVYSQIISSAGNLVTITPSDDSIIFDKVVITFSGDSQNFREIEISGDRLNIKSVPENQTEIATLTITDADTGDTILTTITGDDESEFTLTAGVLTFNTVPNFDSPTDSDGDNNYEITVTADDGNGGIDTQDITIIVTNVAAEVPTIDAQTFTVDENVLDGASVGIVMVTEKPTSSTPTFTYSITGGNTGSAFAIDSSTREITVNGNDKIDFETTPSYELTVQVSNGETPELTGTATITITVMDVNEAPQITLPADFTGDDTASKIFLTASQVSTNISSWNDGDTAANIAKMIDGNTNTDIVNDFAIHSLSANDKHITFTLNERYSKGEFKYYNRTLSDQDRVNGSTVEFFNGDTSVYSQIISSAGNLVTITPPDDSIIIFDKVVITFSGDSQHFREIEISGDRLNIKSVPENQTEIATLTITDVDTGDSPKFSTIIAGDDASAFILTEAGILTFNTAPNFDTPTDSDGDNNYEITVTADDGNGGIDTQDITIIVINVADEVPTIDAQTFMVNENVSGGTSVGIVVVTEKPTSSTPTFTYSITEGNTNNAFAIDPSTREITVNGNDKIDFETTPSYELTVQVSDGGTPALTGTATITITVMDVNEAPQITLPPGFIGNNEASQIPLRASQVSTNISNWNEGNTAANIAKMIDGNKSTAGKDDFAVHPDTDADGKHITFTLNEKYSKGEFKYYNRNVLNQHRVNGSTVEFFNGDTSVSSQIISSAGKLVTITPSDDSIIFDKVVITFSGNSQHFREIEISGDRRNIKSVPENQTAVATLSITDADTGDTILTTITGYDVSAFTLTEAGVLTFNTVPNYESPIDSGEDNNYEITVTADDGNGGIDTQDITIIVTNVVDEVPTIDAQTFMVDENVSDGASVGIVVVTEEPTSSTSTFIYSITGGNIDSAFAIDSSTRAITVNGNDKIDFETKSSYELTVQVSNGGTPALTGTATITIRVTDVDEAPTSISLSSTKIVENAGANEEVGTFSTIDPETNAGFTYALVPGIGDTDNGDFNIQDNSLRLTASASFALKDSYSIRVSVTDDGNNSLEAEFTITVTEAGVNQAPTAVSLTPMIKTLPRTTDVTNRVLLSIIGVTDDELGTNLITVMTLIEITPAFEIFEGNLYLESGTILPIGIFYAEVNVIDRSAGQTTALTINFTLTIINAPIAMPDTGATTENEPVTIDVLANDTDDDADDDSTNFLLLGVAISLDSGLPIDSETPATVTITNNQLVFNPGTDFDYLAAGITTEIVVNYIMSDDGGAESSSTATITITGENDAPVITSNGGGDTAAISVQENQTAVTTIMATDPDTGNTISYTLSGDDSSDSSKFTINTESGVLIFTDAPDFETPASVANSNNYTVEVIATDSNLLPLTDTQTIIITVTEAAVNQAPTEISLTPSSITLPSTTDVTNRVFLSTITITDDGLGINLITVDNTIVSNSPIFEIFEGNLYLSSGTNLPISVFPVEVNVIDSSAGQTTPLTINFILTITFNSVPIATPDTGATTENEPVTIDVLDNDTDADADDNSTNFLLVSVSIESGLPTPSGTPATANTTDDRQLIFDPGTDFDYLAVGEEATVVINYTMKDDEDVESSSTATITITGENDAPSISGNPATSVNESAEYSFTPIGADADDPDGSDFAYSIENKPSWTEFNETTGRLSGTPTNANIGIYSNIVISLTSGIDTVSLDAFELTVANVNDVPVANEDTKTITENPPVIIDVLANDTDIDADDNSTNFLLVSVNIVFGLPTPSGTPATATITTDNQLLFDPGTDFDYLAVGEEATVVINYTMNDDEGAESSSAVIITITGEDDAPIADAGLDRRVNINALVTLDGILSYDPEGASLTYSWTPPLGVTLSDHTAINPTFTTPGNLLGDANCEFTLTVNDGVQDSQPTTVTITILSATNPVPTAVARTATPVVPERTVVTLDGSSSTDPNDGALSYFWASPTITLSNHSDMNPTFTAPRLSIDTDYVFILTVYNGYAFSQTDKVTVTVTAGENRVPTAVASTTTTVSGGTLVTLNGRLSYDPEGIPLIYSWTPPSGITLNDNAAANPTFTAPDNLFGDYNFQFSLTVNDGAQDSQPTTVTVIVTDILDDDEDEDEDISVSPNPATDVIHINNIAKSTTYTLLKLGGGIAKEGTLTEGNNDVNISSLDKGIYLLIIKTDKGSLTKKVIKN